MKNISIKGTGFKYFKKISIKIRMIKKDLAEKLNVPVF